MPLRVYISCILERINWDNFKNRGENAEKLIGADLETTYGLGVVKSFVDLTDFLALTAWAAVSLQRKMRLLG